MADETSCRGCGAGLTEDARDGICPKCLFAQGAALQIQGEATENAGGVSVFGEAGFPREFGDYELLGEIARGGMGVVYRARHRSLDRIVALKLLLFGPLASPEFVKRFRAEASAAASLQHPNIVAIHDVGVHQGQQYFAMDYVDGRSLGRLLANGPLLVRKAARYLKIIAEAIHYAHERGILHRDLKPSNVLIDSNDLPRVTDFGLAKRLDGSTELTLTGQLLGSPNYMPPEQAAAAGKVSRRSDIYSLGAMLYHLMTGRPPFVGESVSDTLRQLEADEPLSPRLLNPSVPLDLETICQKCLEKDAGRRYPTARALAEELNRFLNHEPVHARPIRQWEKSWRWCQRNPVLSSLGAAVALLLVTLTVGSMLAAWRIGVARNKAEVERQRADAERLTARRQLYVSDMTLTKGALQANNLQLALDLLHRHVPQAGAEDLRGFEWRYLWRLCRGDDAVTWREHNTQVVCAAFSPDGKRVVTAGLDKSVRAWDVDSGKSVAVLKGFSHEFRQRCLSFSPEGRVLAVADGENLVLYETRNWKEIARPNGAKFPVRFSADGRSMTARTSGGFERWDTSTWEKGETTASDLRGLDHLREISPDGRWLAAAGKQSIEMWDMSTNTRVTELESSEFGLITALAFSPDSSTLAVAHWDGEVKVWQATAWNRKPVSFRVDGSSVCGLAFSADGKTLATGDEQKIDLWQVAKWTKSATPLRGHLDQVCTVAFSPDGGAIVSGSKDGTAKLWIVERNEDRDQLRGVGEKDGDNSQRDGSIPLGFSEDGKTLLAGNARIENGKPGMRGGKFQFWDVATAQPKGDSRAVSDPVLAGAVSTQGETGAFSLLDGTVKVIRIDTFEQTARLQLEAPATWMRFSPDDRSLAICTLTGPPRIYDLATQKEKMVFTNAPGMQTVVFSPDGKTLGSASSDQCARLMDVATGQTRMTLRGHQGWVFVAAFSPDGDLLATASFDRTARIWETDSGREKAVLRGHRERVVAVAFSPDGRTLATGSTDDTVKLWHVATGQELMTLKEFNQDVHVLLFSPDGKTLVAGSYPLWKGSGPARLWRAPSLAEIALTENALLKSQ